jgi:hypothetical protein
VQQPVEDAQKARLAVFGIVDEVHRANEILASLRASPLEVDAGANIIFIYS